MSIAKIINKYLNEEKNFPPLFNQKLFWEPAKEEGYYQTTIPTKDGDWEVGVKWSPRYPENVNWVELKGKAIADSGKDNIKTFEKKFKEVVSFEKEENNETPTIS
jgi:hypothetical protein